MNNYRSHLETLRKQAAESALIGALTTVPQKRELFAKLAAHLNTLADEVERGMAAAGKKTSNSLGEEAARSACAQLNCSITLLNA